jgi:hypothetical protein
VAIAIHVRGSLKSPRTGRNTINRVRQKVSISKALGMLISVAFLKGGSLPWFELMILLTAALQSITHWLLVMLDVWVDIRMHDVWTYGEMDG